MLPLEIVKDENPYEQILEEIGIKKKRLVKLLKKETNKEKPRK